MWSTSKPKFHIKWKELKKCRNCLETLVKENRRPTQVKKQELGF